jgi:phage antirepressor YoqD-like protein
MQPALIAQQPDNTPNRMSSREVAELTGKNHSDVMRDIRNMVASLQKAELLFVCESDSYTGANGQQYDMYAMDKDTTICLLTGYDVVARMKVVQRWQQLETGRLPQTKAEALRALADSVEREELLQLQLAEAQPAVDFYETAAKCDDAMPVAQAAKVLGVGPIKLFSFLREQKLFMNGTGGQQRNMPYQRGIDAGWFTVVEQTWTAPDGAVHTHSKPMVYQKGLQHINKLLSTSS